MEFLETPIEYLKGVGTARAELLKKELGIFTFADLLMHFPYRHVDRTRVYTIKDIQPDMPYIQLKGKISGIKIQGQKRSQRLTADFHDATGRIELVWFQGIKWIKESLKENKEYIVFGKPSTFQFSYSISHPTLDDPTEMEQKRYLRMMPFYNATERMKARGLDSKVLMKLMQNLLDDNRFAIEENLPSALLTKHLLVQRIKALQQIHFPQDILQLADAQKRLKFEELFFIQLKLLRYKLKRTQLHTGIRLEKIGDLFNTFFQKHLPFELTQAQKRVLKEIRADVKTGKQMNRLLQGDVGSGKTVVALMSMLIAVDNGYQACLMAPTEILAQQHLETISKLLAGLPLQVRLLTGSTKAKERKEIAESIAEGSIQILIGTHALIEDTVKFKNLGMVIIDEQHRFGVEQRAKMWSKNAEPPHVLVMTTTPIPHTLAMTLYGDLDVSVIDELPAGRKPIQTVHFSESKRLRLVGFMREQIAKGRQIYVVYPFIAESEKMDYKNLEHGYQELLQHFPHPAYHLSMVHGKMKNAEKDGGMQKFVSGKAQIMVATTVIEVGVNVPNASVMIIESSERFGLSQLHQLRGRVGRGAEQSYCILMTGDKLSSDARQRIKALCDTNNGFEIAELDLQLRGPGELEGKMQSGVLDLRIADLAKDQPLLMLARQEASDILQHDPKLQLPQHLPLANTIRKHSPDNRWGKIS